MSVKARHYDAIVAPVITEKSTILSEQNKVVFRVPLTATKDEVKEAVRRCSRSKSWPSTRSSTKGKTKRFRGVAGRRSDTKKAIVTLAEGQSIDVTTGL
jgi:large subunit ribosomal protein L23